MHAGNPGPHTMLEGIQEDIDDRRLVDGLRMRTSKEIVIKWRMIDGDVSRWF